MSVMRWLVDGYNVIRRAPELRSREQESLEAGRQALCAMLAVVSIVQYVWRGAKLLRAGPRA